MTSGAASRLKRGRARWGCANNMDSEPSPNPRQLLADIRQRLDMEGLRELVLMLDVDWDELSGDTKSAKGRELIMYMERNGRLAELAQTIEQATPSRRRHRGESSERQEMLDLVHKFWIEDVLEKSRPQGSAIEINLVERKTAVNQPWHLNLPNQQDRSLPPGTRIADIFAELSGLNQTLLILGQPGSGKTMILLELAREAIAWARTDASEPLPVVFTLASWAQKRLPIGRWLVEELKSKYRIPEKIGQRWVEAEMLLLLLDGLDEVPETLRDDCVRAINEFQQSNIMPIVVCCRTEAYELLPDRLALQTAVELQPLTNQQIQTYLQQTEIQTDELAGLLTHNEALQELAQHPLLLHIMAVAYQDAAIGSRPTESTLLHAYAQQMFRHGSTERPFAVAPTMRWLSWLAQQMTQHGQTIFVMEQMQPSWLENPRQQRLYVLLSRLAISLVGGLLGGLIIGLGLFLFFDFVDLREGLLRGLGEGLVSGTLAGLFVAALDLLWQTPPPTQTQTNFYRIVVNMLIVGVGITLAVWLGIGLIFGSLNWLGYSYAAWFFEGQQVGLVTGLCFSLIFGYEPRGNRQASTTDIRIIEYVNLSTRQAIEGGIIGALAGIAIGIARTQIDFSGTPLGNAFPNLRILYVAIPVFIAIGAIFGGLQGSILNPQRLNQTPTSLFRYILLIGGAISVAFSILGAIIGGVAIGQAGAVAFGVYGLLIGLLAIVWYGGLNAAKHYVLRLLLAWYNHIPWRYSRFLDYATSRIFLRKGGGGYMFLHRALLEYFATLPPEAAAEMPEANPPS